MADHVSDYAQWGCAVQYWGITLKSPTANGLITRLFMFSLHVHGKCTHTHATTKREPLIYPVLRVSTLRIPRSPYSRLLIVVKDA